MKRTAIVTAAILCFFLGWGNSFANPEIITLKSALIWRGDAKGDFVFKGNGEMKGTITSDDGSVECGNPTGTYELTTPYKTAGLVSSITMNWLFEGKVTMELSAGGDYVKVIDGVPLEWGKFTTGSQIKWRATFTEGSKLKEVNIVYTDISGVQGDWGRPELTGFKFRKPVYLKGSESGELFNYQLPITIGESTDVSGCDVYIKGVIQSGFSDIRFTQADKQTLIPFWLESVSGEKDGKRKAAFWLKIPQLPKEGLLIYLYYGKEGALDLSDAKTVFDLFAGHDEIIKLDSTPYKLEDKIIEYRAKAESGNRIDFVINDTGAKDVNYTFSSSANNPAEHCIYKGEGDKGQVRKVNTQSAIFMDRFYDYRIILDNGEMSFMRYKDAWEKLEAEADYPEKVDLTTGTLVVPSVDGITVFYDWLRMRQFNNKPPVVDILMTKEAREELPNLASFEGIILAENGDLVLADKNKEGTYSSIALNSEQPARIMVASWKGQTLEGNAIKINISATGEDEEFKTGCQKDTYYYASREDFKAGKTLKWQAVLSRKDSFTASPSLSEFGLDYRPGTITVVSPDGKEEIPALSQYQISWSAWEYEPSYKMKLEYSFDGGSNFNTIAETENTGRYIWAVPDISSDMVLVKVADSLDKDIYDISNNAFSVTGGVLTPDNVQTKITKTEVGNISKQSTGQAKTSAAAKQISAKGKKQSLIAAKSSLEKQSEGQQQAAKQGILTEEESLDVSYLSPLVDNTKRQGTKPYDLLVMPHDNSTIDPAEDKSIYKRGDVIIVQPAGYNWSDNEKNSFLIIQVYLTPEEAEQLLMPKEAKTGQIDKNTGAPVTEIIANRQQRVNLDKFRLKKAESGKKLRAVYEFLKNKPVMRGIIEEK